MFGFAVTHKDIEDFDGRSNNADARCFEDQETDFDLDLTLYDFKTHRFQWDNVKDESVESFQKWSKRLQKKVK
jgi:hypothetical protein